MHRDTCHHVIRFGPLKMAWGRALLLVIMNLGILLDVEASAAAALIPGLWVLNATWAQTHGERGSNDLLKVSSLQTSK